MRYGISNFRPNQMHQNTIKTEKLLCKKPSLLSTDNRTKNELSIYFRYTFVSKAVTTAIAVIPSCVVTKVGLIIFVNQVVVWNLSAIWISIRCCDLVFFLQSIGILN
jgi:hypothetical protein